MSDSGPFPRMFTVDEANATLPLIRPAVEDMLLTFRAIRSEIEEAAKDAGLESGSADLPKHLEARGIAPRLFERVRSLIERIHAEGCLVNGPEAGLIDFPCLFNNEIVFLCWKSGEPRVAHWHRIPDGYAGRRPLLDASDVETSARVH
jgi:hypothetical protein